ncbi:MAG TPA: zinc ABC transporter substrate-binding protein [Gammaproteobacteria bacterium]|nr:zinc ABC transporter substrate-binding protein [Gammaproteobacteria bacterium]
MLKKIILILLLIFSTSLFAKPITIVAAENFYGDIAQQIGGPYVTVTHILNNPNQDPHLFSSNPSTAKSIATADLVIYNGLDYDPWMANLLAPTPLKPRQVIVVADLLRKKRGDNPHIWYDPVVMLTFADNLTQKLSQMDPQHQNWYQQQFTQFKQQYSALSHQMTALKQQLQNVPVIATEPVFNEMAKALGLKMYGNSFQLSVMNDTEPSANDIRDFEDKLQTHQVKVLIYNNQVNNPLTENLRHLAEKMSIPVVGVSETQPVGQDYFSWMQHELNELAEALGKQK